MSSKSRPVACSALLAAMLAMSLAPAAHADRTTDSEDLFRRGKALLAESKYVEACPLLGESYRLEPTMGTLLNLAICHEHVGRIASAWGEFRSVEQQAHLAAPPNESRAQFAREHADKLEPRLSRLKIVVPAESRAPGLVIKIDGEEKSEPMWAGVPIDPGTRSVEVSATLKTQLTLTLKVDDEGVLQSMTVPVLADAPFVEVPTSGGAKLEDVEAYASRSARRSTGFVLGGIGLVTLATGAVFGIAALANDGDAKGCSPCLRGSEAASGSDKATDRALVFANIANVTVPLGALGAAFGAYLVLTAGASRKMTVAPLTSPKNAGLSMSGNW